MLSVTVVVLVEDAPVLDVVKVRAPRSPRKFGGPPRPHNQSVHFLASVAPAAVRSVVSHDPLLLCCTRYPSRTLFPTFPTFWPRAWHRFFELQKALEFPRDEQHAKSTLCSGPEVLAPRNASIDGKRQTRERARARGQPASGEASGKASRALPSPEGGSRRDRAKPSLPATRSRDTLRRLARTLRVDGWRGCVTVGR